MTIRVLVTRKAVSSLAVCLLGISTVLVLMAIARAQQVPSVQLPDSPYRINVSVDEVLLHATVRDRRGSQVTGLQRGDFRIFEDRVPQAIKHFSHEDIPVTAGLVID